MASLVSIITPFLNAEAFFEETIESVIAQTYNNWELLLVDDGSTDRSTEIAQRYAAQYPSKIRYLDHEDHQNRGKSTSRNLGIQQSRGEYIALLDADDVYLPQKLERQVAILQAHPEAGMVYGPTLYWYGWTGKASDQRRNHIATLGITANTLVQPPHLMILYLKKGGVVPCTCGLLVRQTVVRAIGGFSEAIQHMYEDQVFIAKICLDTPVFIEQGCWDKYRQHDGSSSALAIREGEYHPLKLNTARLKFLTWLGDYLTTETFQHRLLLKAYQRAMWPYEHPQMAKIMLPVEYLFRRILGSLETAIQVILPV